MEICLKVKAAGPEIHYFDKHYDRGQDWYVDNLRAVVPGSGIPASPGFLRIHLSGEIFFFISI